MAQLERSNRSIRAEDFPFQCSLAVSLSVVWRREPEMSQAASTCAVKCHSDDERGGYDCLFVEPPHDQLQTKCPVCCVFFVTLI